jgi:hypothetical protein
MSEMQGIEYIQDTLPGMEDPIAAIISQDMIDNALYKMWHNTSGCCAFCGRITLPKLAKRV